MTHWTESAIAAALDGKFFRVDGKDKNEIAARIAAEREQDKAAAQAATSEMRRKIAEARIAAQGGITAEGIITAVAFAHRVGVPDITGGSRRMHISHARQHAMALMRELTGMSFNAIAAAVGIVDHSTAHHGVKTWVHRGHVYAIEDRKVRQMLGIMP
jgi:chromosomal replication initiation ATPase DnaA